MMRPRAFVAIALFVALTACSGKKRSFGQGLLADGGVSRGERSQSEGFPDQTLRESTTGEPLGEVPPGQEETAGLNGVQAADDISDGIGTSDAGTGCPGCSVGGACVAPGVVNPTNFCEVCAPDRNNQGWSNNDGLACDDGLFCTVEDACQEGSCKGADRVCDDNVACNGVSVCVEQEGSCTAGENQCGELQLCDVESDQCVTTCTGCVVEGVCLAVGAVPANNTCLVCDPAQSTTSLSVTVGAPCGSAATECSGQDTCNAQGQCIPNHSAAGTTCGTLGLQCDAEDTCNGTGQCTRSVAQDGSPCDDSQFCTDGDRCQAGQCVSGGTRNCGIGQGCDEAADQCRCQGCVVAGACFAAGSVNPNNPCQICNPSQSASAFVGNVGAVCGSGAVQCSGQDTCSAQGQCLPNHSAAGTPCGNPASGQCDAADSCNGNGQCTAQVLAAGAPCDDGQFCTQGDSCQAGQCSAGSPRNCGQNARCDEGQNACVSTLSGAGGPCSNSSNCESGPCTFWFIDSDGDGFGAGEPTGACGLVPPDIPLGANQALTLTGGDCCPTDPETNPDYTPPSGAAVTEPDACGTFDRDCSMRVENTYQEVLDILGGPIDRCDEVPIDLCEELRGAANGFSTWIGEVAPCGEFGLQGACVPDGGVCTLLIAGPLDNKCH